MLNKNAQLVVDELLKVREDGNKYWNVSLDTAKFLYLIVLSLQAKSVLEVGTSNGFSAIWLASALEKTKGKLTTIESHQDRFDIAKENIKKAGVDKFVNQIRGHAPEDVPKETKYDLVFLDATKYEHLSYIETIIPLLNEGAIVITDNVISHQEELVPYVEWLNKSEQFDNVTIPLGTGLFYSRFR